MRVYDKNKSRLINGIEKVIDRQNAKDNFNIVDFGMNTTITYTNNKIKSETLSNIYFPLKWQPLKYCIKPIPRTYYTYCVSSLDAGKRAVQRMKKKKEMKLNKII